MPPAACMMLLTLLPTSYSTVETVLRLRVFVDGTGGGLAGGIGFRAGVGGYAGGAAASRGGGRIVVLVVLGLRVITCPSGSYFSSVRVVVSKFMSAEMRTMAWPGPRTFSSMSWAFFCQGTVRGCGAR